MDEIGKTVTKTTKSFVDPAGYTGLNRDKKAAPAPAADPGGPGMPDEEATKAAQRRRQAAMQERGGRASTILSADERLGG